MQKKPTMRQAYQFEQHEQFPPEPEPLYEAFPSNYGSPQYGNQSLQNQISPQARNTDTRRTNKSRNENRSPREMHPDNNQMKSSIYKRYTNYPEGLTSEDTEQDVRETTPARSVKLGDTQKGFQQSAASNFFSQENTIKALEDQYQYVLQQNEDLKKQMVLLEVSLHNETLTNEEQRAYIEILKQALESKLSETGLLNFLKSFNQRSSNNGSEADLFIELSNMRTVMESIEREKALGEERIQDLYGQVEQLSNINEKLKQERNKAAKEYEKMANDTQQILDSLQLVKDENDKLSLEKDSLLDYIEELRGKLEQLEQENGALNEELQEYGNKVAQLEAEKNNNDNDDEYYEGERKEGKELDEVLEEDEGNNSNSNENDNEHEQYEDIKQSPIRTKDSLTVSEGSRSRDFEAKKSSIARTVPHQSHQSEEAEENLIEHGHHHHQGEEQGELGEYNMREEELIEENQNLRNNYEALGQQVVDLRQAYEEQAENYDKANENITRLLTEKQQLMKEMGLLKEQNSEFTQKLGQYQEQVLALSLEKEQVEKDFEKLETLEQNNTDLEKEINRYKELVEDTRVKHEKERQAKAEEIKTLYQQASDLRIELRDLKENYQRLKAERDSFEANITDLKEELDKRQKTIVGNLKEINDLKQLSEEKQEQLDLKIAQIERFESQVNELNGFVEECDEKLKRAYEAEEKLTVDLESLTKENKKVKEENKDLHQRFEKNKRDLQQSQQTLTEIIRNVSGETVNFENLDMTLVAVNEKVKGLKRSEESNKKRVFEVEQQVSNLKEEIGRLDERNRKLTKNETDAFAENRKLRSELEQLQDEVNNQQIKNEKISEEFEKLKAEFEKRRKEDDQSFKEKARYLEDKVTRLITEKSSLEYVVTRYREITLNGEINDLIEEAKVAHTQISYLDKDKLDLQVKADVIKNKEKLARRGSPIKLNETANKRNIGEIEEGLAEIEVNIEIYSTKKQSIEKELVMILEKEREKYFGYFEFERQNYQLKAELELLNKENQLITQTRETLEASYNDLIKEIRKSRIDDKLNASIYSPGERRSYRRNFSPGERGSYEKKSYYGKTSELERTKDHLDYNSNPKSETIRERGEYLSRKDSRKYIRTEENESTKQNPLK